MTGPIHPDAYRAISEADFAQAYELNRALRALRSAEVHGTPPGFTEQQKAQRQAILNLAYKIIEADRDRAMDAAVAKWSAFRRMTR